MSSSKHIGFTLRILMPLSSIEVTISQSDQEIKMKTFCCVNCCDCLSGLYNWRYAQHWSHSNYVYPFTNFCILGRHSLSITLQMQLVYSKTVKRCTSTTWNMFTAGWNRSELIRENSLWTFFPNSLITEPESPLLLQEAGFSPCFCSACIADCHSAVSL